MTPNYPQVFESPRSQRAFGAVVAASGMALLVATWAAGVGPNARLALGAVGPSVLVVGLGMVVRPLDLPAIRARYGPDAPGHLSHYPRAWRVIALLTLLAGAAGAAASGLVG